MTYDPKFKNNVYYLSETSTWFYSGDGNYYWFRSSDKNDGGYLVNDGIWMNAYDNDDDSYPNDMYAYYFISDTSTVTIGMHDSQPTVLYRNGNDMLGIKPSDGNYSQLTAGFHFSNNGVVDFANATGHVAMGENVELEKSVISVLNVGTLYTIGGFDNEGNKVRPVSTSILDISAIHAEKTLTIEGSLMSNIYTESRNMNVDAEYGDITAWYEVNYNTDYSSNYESRFTHISNRRQVAAGLRGENISLEQNMEGTVNVLVSNQYYLDFVKTSFENVVIQAAGFLADGASPVGETGLSVANGTISLGNTLGGYNSLWSGAVNVQVQNIEIGSRIYEKNDPNEAINDGGVGNYETLGNKKLDIHPVTGEKVEKPWEWYLDKEKKAHLDDEVFLDDSTKTKVENNIVAAHGLYGKNIELGNMTGRITSELRNVTLYAEFAHGTGEGANGSEVRAVNADHIVDDDKKDPYYGQNYSGNTATVAGIETDNLKITGDFGGTIIANFQDVKSVTTETEFKYSPLTWLFPPHDILREPEKYWQWEIVPTVDPDTGEPTGKSEWQLVEKQDSEQFIALNVNNYKSVWGLSDDEFDELVDKLVELGYQYDDTGYFYFEEDDNGNPIYEDPYTGGYVRTEDGYVFENQDLTGELYKGELWSYLVLGDDGKPVVGADGKPTGERKYYGYGQHIAVYELSGGYNPVDGRGYYRRLFNSNDDDPTKNGILQSWWANHETEAMPKDFVPYYYEREITRTSSSLDVTADPATTKYAYGFLGSAYGIHAKTITIDGPFSNEIRVTAGDSILKSLTVRGIEAESLTAENGLFAPEIRVEVAGEQWGNILTSSDSKDPEAVDPNVTVLVLGTLKAEALGGTYTVETNNLGQAYVFNIGKFDSVFDNDADSSTFNITADVTSEYNVFANGGSWDLRFSGDITAGNGHNNEAAAERNIYGKIAEEDDEGFTVTNFNEVFELAAGATMYGDWNFGIGNDTLTIDSNARMNGKLIIGKGGAVGTFNLIFNLNDRVLKTSDAETTGAILNGVIDIASSGTLQGSALLTTVSLNDVVLTRDPNGAIVSKRYTIIDGQPSNENAGGLFARRFTTVDLKYDGLNLKTPGNLEIQIGYLDDNDNFVQGNLEHKAEITEDNFVATIGTKPGVDGNCNVVRVIDTANNDEVIFQAHSELTTANGLSKVDIIVDCLPDMVELPNSSGDTYYVSRLDSGIENLHGWYNEEDKTYTVIFDDHNVDLTNISYEFEYYIQDVENGQVVQGTDTNTILRKIKRSTDLNPRTEVVLNGIGENQKVFWRVRQIYGTGSDCSGKWYSIEDFQYTRPQDLCQFENADGSYTLEWKHQEGATYRVKYTVVANNGTVTEYTPDTVTPADSQRKASYEIPADVFNPGDRLLGWNVTAVNGDTPQSETAVYQDLQIEKTVLATPSGFKVHRGDAADDVVFTWSNSCKSTQVKYKLEYRIVGTDTTVAWTSDDVTAESDIANNVTYTAENLTPPTSDQKLEWRVTAYQDNGEEMLYSKTGNAVSTIRSASGNSIIFTTTEKEASGTSDNVTFTWNYDNDINTGFRLEYIAGGKWKTVDISRAKAMDQNIPLTYYNANGTVEYVYDSSDAVQDWVFRQNGTNLPDADLRNLSFSCNYEGGKLVYDAVTGEVTYTLQLGSSAAGNIEWRVRELDNAGEVSVDNKWHIYETEQLRNFDTDLTETRTEATLKFESNVIGSSYRLEYVIDSVPQMVTFNNVNTKYFEHTVTGLTNGQVAWRVAVKAAGENSWGEWQYADNNMSDHFTDTYLLDAPTAALNRVESDSGSMDTNGRSAIASLYWEPGTNISKGLDYYVVEYFQSKDALKADKITERFDDEAGLNDDKFARIQVTNNELTLADLQDNQYIYWRVKAVDYDAHESEWTIGDPLRVALNDANAPTFDTLPPQATQEWIGNSDLRKITLTWNPAKDDSAGVKRYHFSLLGGTADHLKDAVYEYSLDGGDHWNTLDYKDGVGIIEHLASVTSYMVRVSNVGNSDFDWSLTAVDFQNKSTTIKSNTSASDSYTGWEKDETAPQFIQQNNDYMEKHEGYSDIEFTMGGTRLDDDRFSMTPTVTWTPAGDNLHFNEDFTRVDYAEDGSGVDYYLLEWDMYGKTFSVTIDVDDLSLEPNDDGKYEWVLNTDELLAQNLPLVDATTGYPLVIPNGEYSWRFYAVDHAGQKSAALKPSNSESNWKPDEQAPVFINRDLILSDDEIEVQAIGSEFVSVTVTWDTADVEDYWFDPNVDSETSGSGVKSYVLTYTNGTTSNTITIDLDELVDLGNGQVSVTFFAPNPTEGVYNFTIKATDYCNNTTADADALQGSWGRQEPVPMEGIRSEVSFNDETGAMIGAVRWEADVADASYFVLSYSTVGGNADPTQECRILKGFKGDTSAFSDVATFTSVSANVWTVTFNDETSYKLTYNSADGSYTMSNETLELSFSESSEGFGFTAAWEVEHGDYAWYLTKDGTTDPVGSDKWAGDSTAPVFEDSALTGVLEENEASPGIGVITITINNASVIEEESKIDYYLVQWGTVASKMFDQLEYVFYDEETGGYSVSFEVSTLESEAYHYRVIAVDNAGNMSVAVNGPNLLEGDSAPPRIPEINNTGTSVIVSGENKMTATLSWKQGADDKHEENDGDGVGIKDYTLTLYHGSTSTAMTILGDDLTRYWEDPNVTVTGYTVNRDEVTLEITSITKTFTVANTNIKGKLTFTVTDGVGQYSIAFTGLEAKDHYWTLSATDNKGNTSKVYPGDGDYDGRGIFVGDKIAPKIEVTPASTRYDSNQMHVTLTIDESKCTDDAPPATDTAVQGSTGIKEYVLVVTKTKSSGGASSGTPGGETSGDTSADTPEIIKEVTFPKSLASYTKEENGNVYTLTQDGVTISYNADNQTYTVQCDLTNDNYTWEVVAKDHAGNVSNSVTGNWDVDVAAPVFTKDVTSSCDIATEPESAGKMKVEASWTYLPGGADNTVVDPAAADKKDDIGSGIESFTFHWRKEGDTEWKKVTISTSESSKPGSSGVTITQSDAGVYTVSSDTMDPGKYEWYVTAKDKIGNESVAFGETTQGGGTGDTNSGTDSSTTAGTFSDKEYSGYWNGLIPPEFTGGYTDVEYVYQPGYDKDVTFTWSAAKDGFDGTNKVTYTLSWGTNSTGTEEDSSSVFTPVGELEIALDALKINADGTVSYSVLDRIFTDGEFSWMIKATDQLGNTQTLAASEKFRIDRNAPEGSFNAPVGIVTVSQDGWEPVFKEWLDAKDEKEVDYYLAKDATVMFTFENTFEDVSGITYEVRTYGKSTKSQEVVNMHTFTSNTASLTLSDDPGMGAGYLMNLPNNEVFWDVRAIDGIGNATQWVAGRSFMLVDQNYSASDMYKIQDKTAPAAPFAATMNDSIEDGGLDLAWSTVYDAFGVDHYDLAVYDASGKTLLKEFTADATDTGLLHLTQNDLTNGNYLFQVRAVDCAGNAGKYSALTAFTYDVIRPEFDIDSVECKVANGSATFTWDSMSDNLKAGKYSIMIQRDGVIEVAQETTDTSFVWNNIPSYGTFSYTIRAFDADGNESASVKDGSFIFEKPVAATYYSQNASVSGTVGAGYAADIWKVDFNTPSADGEYAAAEVDISLRVFTEESAGVDLIIRDKNGIRLSTVSVDSSWDGTFYWNEEKSMNNYYTVEVVPHDDSEKTAYALSINKTEYEDSNILDNTFEQARDNANYRVVLTDDAEQQIIEDEWLGFSDECDFRQIMVDQVAQDKVYTFEANIAGLNMTLWQDYNGVLLAIAQGENSIDDVSLKSSATYYLEIDSMGAKSVNYGVLASCG